MLNKIKLALRIDDNTFDEEINDCINMAKADLKFCGVLENKIVDTDPLILRAIKIFCKAEFSTDDKETARYRDCYEKLRDHLTLSKEYTKVII